jgi:HSP20 family molecular chaperone IbpA
MNDNEEKIKEHLNYIIFTASHAMQLYYENLKTAAFIINGRSAVILDLIKEDEDKQRIELAVAGYSKEDIDISVKVDLLTIKGYKKEEYEEGEFIHQGIAGREWKQEFVLGEWISVKEATLKDGLLTIRLEREMPEELKPKIIKIK